MASALQVEEPRPKMRENRGEGFEKSGEGPKSQRFAAHKLHAKFEGKV